MAPEDEALNGLREALKVSPNNLPLRVHLAQTLVSFGRFEEAAAEYRNALSLSPDHGEVKYGLASAYLSLGEQSKAMVILEDLCRSESAPAKAFIVLAKLLLGEGKVRDAVIQYKEGIQRDPACADPILGDQLGVGEAYQDGDVVEGRSRESSQRSPEIVVSEIERPKIKFDDVGGMDKLKEEIRLKILYPLQHPEMYEAYGKKIGGGILMYGPPGCGKTYLARATAGELGAGFISVGISDVLDMWTGQSERNLAQIFEQARVNQPCVLFFDEVDALGGRRSDMSSGAGRHVINQFLAEMDGVKNSNEGVLVLAATNAPWHVDPAFRRPGRFDRVLFVPPPDNDARAEVLRIHLKGKPQDSIDFQQIAKKTAEFSGADMKAVVDQAIEEKLRIALKEGIPKPLVTKDLIGAAKSLSPTTREWFSTARNYAIYSNQGGIYDDVLKYLNL
ncbi:ATP-dependent zinc metalloprotease FtsH [Novipirellula galeiformis]|uniref:ATP-dependent zinc metalloprotease FtsH n=1 Tax=Novipirellula galeiformis TaxID=2528004 RepID=A0A5C6BZ69_9BACT|nr:ATP-binding protein [Novipirellula galeiformis]TWU17630.1 ATP-dependent zinc metalloprotease FtsH [Novipirellula galeiformis]